ncbi:hypothetical protein L228DRAFT_238912 [Xylona heveae TC161]|uniref:MARVEL domain-containing protein n=1 Tax=Xylona heveae (strain CBS 132557 / TC161) TaxID=1328760 RepID=A0A165H5S7_XYLHT|nr:hypothetical protein L228DRAFT_238912 [Xylona heveae TC161]KZF23025.1 hypothetical protein L228DRAFT_238912 [Xylona heveae TC161]
MIYFINKSPSQGGLIGAGLRTTLRFLQFVMALTVAGLYGVDLNNVRKHGLKPDPAWVYAEVIAGFAALTCIFFLIPFVKSWYLFAWDATLFILWIAVFGVFAQKYGHKQVDGNAAVQRMKNAVWVDLVNVLLWLISATYGAIRFFYSRRSVLSSKTSVV